MGVAPCVISSAKAVGSQYLGGGHGKVLAGEPPVVPDDDPLPSLAMRQQICGKPLGAPAHIVEGVILGDSTSPAVRAKLDVCHVLY